MPELPDVELQKRTLDRTAMQRRVESVSVRHRKVLRVAPGTLRRRVRGKRLVSSRRHGKLLFAGLDGRGEPESWLVLHFGMTGFLTSLGEEDDAPEHARVVFDLDDGRRLAYDCQRMFGRVDVVDDADAYLEEHDLGPDALDLDADGFLSRLRDRRGSIKAALMDQSLMAGVGNVYSDEALFRARIHPRTPVGKLDEKARRRLHRALHQVLEGAIDRHANPEEMPRTWLLPRRALGERCPRCGTKLQRRTVNQRSAWLCPQCQRR